MRSIISFALRNRTLHGYLRRVYDENISQIKATSTLEIAVPEASAIQARASSFRCNKRLNLLLPALSTEHVFGGISTALNFLMEITKNIANVRIILTEQVTFAHSDNASFSDWKICQMDDLDEGGRLIIAAGNRYEKSLSISPNDYFIATAWWTAISAQSLQAQQQILFGLQSKNKYIYLIQDYEPGFYPWSSRYAMAESTYRNSENFIAVFNTSILHQFFLTEGYKFSNSFCFEPVLHQQLRPFLSAIASTPRERKILIYGRPTVDRNAFPIIVMALQSWVKDNEVSDWSFISAGEPHPPVELGNGNKLVSLGKLSIKDYAHELLTAYAGISLMISPHPSYPPLEMAAFGVHIITNDYKSKNLSLLCSNIHSVPWASPTEIAQKLQEITKQYDQQGHIELSQCLSSNCFFDKFCHGSNPFEPLIDKILNNLETQG